MLKFQKKKRIEFILPLRPAPARHSPPWRDDGGRLCGEKIRKSREWTARFARVAEYAEKRCFMLKFPKKKRIEFVLPLRPLRLCGEKIRKSREWTARFARVAETGKRQVLFNYQKYFSDKIKNAFILPLRPLRLCGEKIPGFTLVELMIVMGVIIILVAMLFPVIIGAKEKARKKQALTEAHNVVLALKGYRMEFDQWPNQTQATNDTTYFTNNHLVIMPLMGHNARGKVFLAVQATNQTDSVTNLVDPWGVPYVICINEDMSTNCLINFLNVRYDNIFVSSGPKYYSATNYSVANMEVAVASFVGTTNANQTVFSVETWSEPQ